MNERNKSLRSAGSARDVDTFLSKVANTPLAKGRRSGGRLLFAMDATASREPTWDKACTLQAEMFEAAADAGGLHVQLVYFRGFHEFYATKWLDDPRSLSRSMTQVRCAGGLTQIERVLRHTLTQARDSRVDALVYVGDCMEENVDNLCQRAGELGLRGVPAFVFQEGSDPVGEKAFREMARLTRGAYCRFDSNSVNQLKALLRAAAVFAAGGRSALDKLALNDRDEVKLLARQLD